MRLIAAALLAIAIAAGSGPSNAAQPVGPAIGELLQKQGMAGAVWSTVGPDGSIVTGATGVRDARSGDPMQASDKVQVGSITKTLIATGILRLVSEGRLRLDSPVAELLPAVAIENRWAAESPVRLRHLLDHRSGLDDARLWQVFSAKASPDVPLREAVDVPLKVRSRPGSRFSYSNTGFTLLGMVIEAAAGERYETYLDRTLLAPLGMRDSSFAFVTQATDPRLAMGHFEGISPHGAVPLFLRPASQFTTTAHDMGLFARFLLGDGAIRGKRYIDPRLMRARGRPSNTDAARAGLESGYGFGLARQERGGAAGLCHGGDTVGYRAMLCIYPDEGKAFFRAVNADVEGADYRSIDGVLIGSIGLAKPAVVAAVPMPPDIARWEGWYVPSPARFESFAYLDHVLGFSTASRDGGRLRLQAFQSRAQPLVPVGGRLFRAEDRSLPSHVLHVDRDGERLISDGNRSLRKVGWWQLPPLWLSLAAGVGSIIYILVAGLVRAAKRTLRPSHPMFVPSIAVAALAIPAPLFLGQSFLAMGDLTLASGALAIVTALLPFSMVYGLVKRLPGGIDGWPARLDILAMAGVLQWSAVLAAWGLLPLRLWA